MANRRMFSKKIVDTDAFLDMSLSAQALYLHLLLRADDDGFIANPKKIMRMLGSQDDDYKILIAKRFIIQFESGVCVIKHWLIHNLIRNDRYTATQWTKEKNELVIDDKTKKYSLPKPKDYNVIPNGNQMAPQVRLGKVRLGKVNKFADKSANKENKIITLFKKINPTINYGNKTQRSAVTTLIEELGYDKLVKTVEYCVSVQGNQYAPTITTPLQLKNKLGDLLVYWKKNNTSRTVKV